jgi:hypothetical protein
VVNEVEAGAVVELSFDLGGAYGTGIVKAGFPQVAPMTCDSRRRAKAAPATGTTLAFASGTYTIRWQTDPAWAGKCRAFILKLRDTTLHSAEFRFN